MSYTPPGSAIQVKTKYRALAFILGLCHPQLELDGGTPVVGNWGETTIPVPPGRHTVRCWFHYLYLKQAGNSSVTVDVAPGQVVSVSYVAPWLVFLAGKWTVGDGAAAVGAGGSSALGAGAPYQSATPPYSAQPPSYGSNVGPASYASGPSVPPYGSMPGVATPPPAAAASYGSYSSGAGAPAPGPGTPHGAPYQGASPTASNPSAPAQTPSVPGGDSGGARETVVFAPGPFQQPRSSAAAEPPAVASAAAAGWLADPAGRHQLRYWDGRAWTEHVSDGGVTGVDAV